MFETMPIHSESIDGHIATKFEIRTPSKKIHMKIINLRCICTRRQIHRKLSSNAYTLEICYFLYDFFTKHVRCQILWQCSSIESLRM